MQRFCSWYIDVYGNILTRLAVVYTIQVRYVSSARGDKVHPWTEGKA